MGITLQHEAPQSRTSPPVPPTSSPTVNARLASRTQRLPPTAKVVLPVRYSAWLSGDMGRALERTLENALSDFAGLRITKLPRAFLIEAHEEAGPMLEAVYRAAVTMERGVETTYPVFHHEMGPVWTGTLQSVFT